MYTFDVMSGGRRKSAVAAEKFASNYSVMVDKRRSLLMTDNLGLSRAFC